MRGTIQRNAGLRCRQIRPVSIGYDGSRHPNTLTISAAIAQPLLQNNSELGSNGAVFSLSDFDQASMQRLRHRITRSHMAGLVG
jgi:hypothetical protein